MKQTRNTALYFYLRIDLPHLLLLHVTAPMLSFGFGLRVGGDISSKNYSPLESMLLKEWGLFLLKKQFISLCKEPIDNAIAFMKKP